MGLHRLVAHDEALGDLAVRQPLGHQPQHFGLARGELGERVGAGGVVGRRRANPLTRRRCAACFQVGQWLLRGNGFNYEGGYPAVTLADRDALRAVVGSGVYLGLLTLFSLSVGAIVRHTAAAITIVLAAVLAPVIAIGFLPENLAEPLEKSSLMGAGLAMQQTFERPDNIPLDPAQGLAVVSAYGFVTLVVALWVIGRRDA